MASDDALAPPPRGITCPLCQQEARLVRSVKIGGRTHYAEIVVYECLVHGPVYHTREGLKGEGPDNVPHLGDGDSLRPVPRTRTPPLKSGSIAVPEPD